MKRLLLPFILLFTIPFNTSCIKELTFDVVVTGVHCTWKEPTKKAVMGHDYFIEIKPDESYELFMGQDNPEGDGIYIETENAGCISKFLNTYDEETSVLKIPANYVSSKITIVANAKWADER